MTSLKPLVSVIIPAYNCARYLGEALESILNQTYQDFEIIVVDDGSTDNTGELVNSYTQRYPDKIRYIYQENGGPSKARNTGIRNAGGEFIALLDADDKWAPERLEKGINVLETDPTIGLVHSNAMTISEEGRPIGRMINNKKFLSGYIWEPLFLREADVLCLTVLFRKECCAGAGLFDENPLINGGCEDKELWLRIARRYKIQYIDNVLGYYRKHTAGISRNRQRTMQARLYVIDKFCPAGGKNQILRNKALAKIYKEAGDKWLFDRDFAEAKRNYLMSLRYWPFSIWPFINLVKAVLKVKVAADAGGIP